MFGRLLTVRKKVSKWTEEDVFKGHVLREDYVRSFLQSDERTRGCSQITNSCAKLIFFNANQILIGTFNPVFNCPISIGLENTVHGFESSTEVMNLLNLIIDNINQSITPCDIFSLMMRYILQIKTHSSQLLVVNQKRLQQSGIVHFVLAVTSFIFGSGPYSRIDTGSSNSFKFYQTSSNKYIYWEITPESVICGTSKFLDCNFHSPFVLRFITTSHGLGTFNVIDKKVTRNVIIGEDRFYLGIINTWGCLEFRLFCQQTPLEMIQLKEFMEKILNKINQNLTNQDFCLFLWSILQIKNNSVQFAVFKTSFLCSPYDYSEFHEISTEISSFIFNGKFKQHNSISTCFSGLSEDPVSNPFEPKFLHWVYDTDSGAFLCYKSDNPLSDWKPYNKIPHEKGIYIKGTYPCSAIFIPYSEFSYRCLFNCIEMKYLEWLIRNLLIDDTPRSVLWRYITWIVELAKRPGPTVFRDIIGYLKQTPYQSILDISRCIFSSERAKSANGNPLTIEVIEFIDDETTLHHGLEWSIHEGRDLVLINCLAGTEEDDTKSVISSTDTENNLSVRMNVGNLLANTDRVLFSVKRISAMNKRTLKIILLELHNIDSSTHHTLFS